MRHAKIAYALLTLAVLLAATSSAYARSLSLTNRQFRAVWAPMTLSEPFGFYVIRCNLTMEGSFHEATFAKAIGTLVGNVTRASMSHPCTGGESWIWNGTEGALTGATSLPWPITYQAFVGTLPNITSISLSIHQPKLTISSFACLGTFEKANWVMVANRSAFGTMTWSSSGTGGVTWTRLAGSCPEPAAQGTSTTVTLLGTTTGITLTLI